MNSADAHNPRFESATDAIVAGDLPGLQSLLAESKNLIHARSQRNHHATLLHYLGANGVEDFRQKSPLNAVAVAKVLLDAGAAIDSVADLYGGSTTLELVATSFPPQEAGVQLALMETLLTHGADPERGGSLVNACLANNRLPAAEFLAARGLALDLSAAAGLGRVSRVRELLAETPLSASATEGNPSPEAQGFLWACAYGQDAVLPIFLDRGMPVDTRDRFGQTGLHLAAMGLHESTIQVLRKQGANLEAINGYGGTVLGQTLWSAAHARNPDAFHSVITVLRDAGARIPHRLPPVSPGIDALLASWGYPPDPALGW
jgi:hypothetical protein